MFTKRLRPFLFMAGALFLLTACNFPGSSTQPTLSPDLIYTAAAQTLTAQQTQAAEGTPIVIPSPTPSDEEASPTSPVVILPTNTALPPTNTTVPTNTPLPNQHAHPSDRNTHPHPLRPGSICKGCNGA